MEVVLNKPTRRVVRDYPELDEALRGVKEKVDNGQALGESMYYCGDEAGGINANQRINQGYSFLNFLFHLICFS